ncbi:MAG TPA: class I SAM-dependent methyltransferase [Kiloniellales bacterium]|jgi:predicted O-methyltransferase YrrM|nr:class I SAM-dependent methyltransferase [Kiloniellales bacterium]
MSKQIEITSPLVDYLLSVSLREDPLLKELREETARSGRQGMQIAPHQGQFMRLLAELIGVKRAIEVGTFTGYSALCTALAMPADGRLVCCDVSEEWTSIARRFWQKAGVAERIDLRVAPAAQTLDALIAAGESGTYDWLFIDADKSSYGIYYEKGLELLRPGGLILVDNVLWGGDILREEADLDPEKDRDTLALQAFNRKLLGDQRISLSLVPIGDGLTLARKR